MPSAQPVDILHTGNSTDRDSIRGGNIKAQPRRTRPVTYTGLLDAWNSYDSTPAIGREFSNLQVVDLLRASNSDEVIKDLAVTSTTILYLTCID